MNEIFKQLEKQSRELVRTGSGAVFIEYLKAIIDHAKEDLVDAKPEDIPGLQGFIKKTRQTINSLTTKPAEPQKHGAYSGG